MRKTSVVLLIVLSCGSVFAGPERILERAGSDPDLNIPCPGPDGRFCANANGLVGIVLCSQNKTRSFASCAHNPPKDGQQINAFEGTFHCEQSSKSGGAPVCLFEKGSTTTASEITPSAEVTKGTSTSCNEGSSTSASPISASSTPTSSVIAAPLSTGTGSIGTGLGGTGSTGMGTGGPGSTGGGPPPPYQYTPTSSPNSASVPSGHGVGSPPSSLSTPLVPAEGSPPQSSAPAASPPASTSPPLAPAEGSTSAPVSSPAVESTPSPSYPPAGESVGAAGSTPAGESISVPASTPPPSTSAPPFYPMGNGTFNNAGPFENPRASGGAPGPTGALSGSPVMPPGSTGTGTAAGSLPSFPTISIAPFEGVGSSSHHFNVLGMSMFSALIGFFTFL